MLSWVSLTNLPATDFKATAEKIGWYTKRFGIQVWYKVLKSGCKAQDCLLETTEPLSRYLTLFSILGARSMYLTYLAHAQPELSANEDLSHEEIEALRVRLYAKPPPPEPISLRKTVRLIGRIGGHLDRKGDGKPGITVTSRSWMRLHEDVIVTGRIKQTLGWSTPSQTMNYCRRPYTMAEIEAIRERFLTPGISRYLLPREVYDRLAWRAPNGRIKEMGCRVATLRMQADGLMILPAPKIANPPIYRPDP